MRVAAGAALLAAALAVIFSFWRIDGSIRDPVVSTAGGDRSAKPETARASRSSASGYLGPQVCAECHADRVAEFVQTGHYNTCRVPEPEDMPPGFAPDRGTFVSRFPGLRFEMTRRSDGFIQTSVRETAAGEQRSSASIDLILGAGTADDVYLSWRDDGTMHELPMAWLWTSDEWGASYFDPHGSGDFSRPLTARCLECHNTWVDHVPGTRNQYRRSGAILGVTCERCHGPGAEHVAFHQAYPDALTGEAIGHPGELARERQIEVCTQCHSNAITPRGPAFRYRPGEPLDEHYRTLTVAHTEDDHVANQIKYLRESACFQQSETMTCITCHDPHRPHEPGHSGSESCRQCHEPAHCGERERLPSAVRDNCVGCHMPQYIKINVNFQTADDNHVPPIRRYDHRIAVHETATKEVLLDWHRTQSDLASRDTAVRLAEELVRHYRTRAQVHRGEHRTMAVIAALREALRIEDRPEVRKELQNAVELQTRIDDLFAEATHEFSERRFARATDLLQKLLTLKPDHAEAHYRLGMAYATTGEKDLAVKHLRVSGEHDPDSVQGHAMLGWLAFLDGEMQRALEHFARAEQIEPYSGKINYQIGLTLVQLGDFPAAAERFRRTLEIEPQRIDACQSLVSILLQQGRFEDAAATAERTIGALQSVGPDAMTFLAETYAAGRRFDDAAAAAERALELIPKDSPAAAIPVRRRILEFRASAVKAGNR